MSGFDSQIERMRGKRNAKREADRTARELQVEQLNRARDQKRKENRLKFPEITGVVDMLADAGFEPRVLYAKEGGNEAGKRG